MLMPEELSFLKYLKVGVKAYESVGTKDLRWTRVAGE